MILQLIEGGFIGQAVIATGLMFALVWQVVHNIPIDPLLAGMLGTVLGYYFHVGVVAARRQ